ncbi:ATP-binding protein [Kitasatospora sp. NPDC059327]|uniref:ATP-binding protein n=1 Tax=Kitasatospora sp. NPDC059327 TaxID=3346803 RepID=UPI00367B9C31
MPEACNGLPTATGPHQQSTWLPKHRRSAGTARLLLREFLHQQPNLAERFSDVGELLLSELVANAVQHPRVPADRLLLVHFVLSLAELRIEVHDAGDDLPTHPAAAAALPDHEAETGRGLFLVQHLSRSWGCFPRPGGIGKAVWCAIAPDDDAPDPTRSPAGGSEAA